MKRNKATKVFIKYINKIYELIKAYREATADNGEV